MRDNKEERLQIACVNWFRLQYREYAPLLFAVANGGNRSITEAIRLKKGGVVAGVSDLILLKSNEQYNALCIEIKTDKGRQSQSQRQWQQAVEEAGAKYVICRNFEEFKNSVSNYVNK